MQIDASAMVKKDDPNAFYKGLTGAAFVKAVNIPAEIVSDAEFTRSNAPTELSNYSGKNRYGRGFI